MAFHHLMVINPVSGTAGTAPLYSAIRKWEERHDDVVQVYETTGSDDTAKIEKILTKNSVDTIIAAGGDGTLLECAAICRSHDVPLGFVPRGTANGMAVQLGIPDDAGAALDIIGRRKCRATDMLRFNDEYCGLHISDVGFNARIVEYYARSGGHGFWNYTKGLIEGLRQIDTFQVRIKGNPDELLPAQMVAFANARYYGTGIPINHTGRLDDGYFELCIFHELSLSSLAGNIFNWPAQNREEMVVRQCKEVELEFSTPQPFQIDGEIQSKVKQLKVAIEAACLQLIVP